MSISCHTHNASTRFYCVDVCCVVQTHSVCLLTQIIHGLRFIFFHQMCFCHKFSRSTHSSKMVWLVTFVVCLAPGFTRGPSGCPPQPGHNLVFALYGVESDLRRQSGLELLIPHACMFTIRTFIASSYSNCK